MKSPSRKVEYLVIKNSAPSVHEKGSRRVEQNAFFLSITLALPLQEYLTRVRLVIRGEPGPVGQSVIAISPCNDRSVFSDEYWLSYKPNQTVTGVTDDSEDPETTCTVDLTFHQHFGSTDVRQPWEPGGYLYVSQPPPPPLSVSPQQPKLPLFNRLYEYRPESPIFLTLASTHRIIDADHDCDAVTLFNFNFHVAPVAHLEGSDSSAVTICDLPTELLLLVSHHAAPHKLGWWRSRPCYSETLLSLSLVNRRFYSIFLPALYSAFGQGYPIAVHLDALEKFALSLSRQPRMRQHMTRFTYKEFPKVFGTKEIKAYSEIFSLATGISHMEVLYRHFRHVVEHVSKMDKMETFRLRINSQEYGLPHVFQEIHDALCGWPALTKLDITQHYSRPTQILGIGPEPSERDDTPKVIMPPFSLVELRLRGGYFTPEQVSAILTTSKSSLHLLYLHEVAGLTNDDLLEILSDVGPSLTTLQVTWSKVTSGGAGSLAIDSILPRMRNLVKLLVTDNVVTPACLSAKQGCPDHRHRIGPEREPCCSFTVDVPVQRLASTEWTAKALTEELQLKPTQLVTASINQDLGWGRMVIHLPESSNHFTGDMEDHWAEMARKRGSKFEVIRGQECKHL